MIESPRVTIRNSFVTATASFFAGKDASVVLVGNVLVPASAACAGSEDDAKSNIPANILAVNPAAVFPHVTLRFIFVNTPFHESIILHDYIVHPSF
ncbi:hypothetical protein D3C73_1215700 [compost metagenome]